MKAGQGKRQRSFFWLYCLRERFFIGEGEGNENYSVDYCHHFYRGSAHPDRGLQTDFLIALFGFSFSGHLTQVPEAFLCWSIRQWAIGSIGVSGSRSFASSRFLQCAQQAPWKVKASPSRSVKINRALPHWLQRIFITILMLFSLLVTKVDLAADQSDR